MQVARAALFWAIAALLAYMAYYAFLNIADGDLSYLAVAVVELAAAGALAMAGFSALQRD